MAEPKFEMPPETTAIYTVVNYCDDHGRRIEERLKVGTMTLIPEHACFIAFAQANIMTPHGPQTMPLQAQIDGASCIQDAFAKFDEVMNAEAKKMHDEIRSQLTKARIMHGGGAQLPPGLVGG